MKLSEFLQAPDSRAPLSYDKGRAVSLGNNNESYDMRDGIVIFDPSDLESENVRNNLRDMLEMARATDCATAIQNFSDSPEYLLNEQRCYYLDLLNLQPNDIVLEIGASLGQHSRLIANKCCHLEALEIVPDQAIFAQLWCEQSGHDNVNVCAGGARGNLPYKNSSFDVLIINYVLEWSAGRSGVHPADYHLQLLAECFRVIKPGGSIFLSTKNRHGIRLLLGGFDEHSGFRFGSALPRWLCRLIQLSVKHPDTRGYLHSKREIETLFEKVGFTNLTPYLLLPDARTPKMVEKFDQAGIGKIRKQGYWSTASRKEKIFSVLPYGIQKHIAPSHVYIATKPQLP